MASKRIFIDMNRDELVMLRCLDMCGQSGTTAMQVCMMCGLRTENVRGVRRRLDKLVDAGLVGKLRNMDTNRCAYSITDSGEDILGGHIYAAWIKGF